MLVQGYGPSEWCDITAQADGTLDTCPTWSFDWMGGEFPCFSDAAGWDRNSEITFSQTYPDQCGMNFEPPACPVGKQITNGDPVFWQSDSGIQGALSGESSFQGIGLPPADGPELGLGGGWALCFA